MEMEPEDTSEVIPIKNFFNKVTPLSKYLAMALFIIMPFLGGWVGYKYAQKTIPVIEKPIFYEEVIITKEVPVYVTAKEHTVITQPTAGEKLNIGDDINIKYSTDSYLKLLSDEQCVSTELYLLSEENVVLGYLGDWDTQEKNTTWDTSQFFTNGGLDLNSSSTSPGEYRLLMVARYPERYKMVSDHYNPGYTPDNCNPLGFDTIDHPDRFFVNGILYFGDEIDDLEGNLLSAVSSDKFFLVK